MITAFQAENGKIFGLEEQAIQEDEKDRLFNELKRLQSANLDQAQCDVLSKWITEHFTRKQK